MREKKGIQNQVSYLIEAKKKVRKLKQKTKTKVKMIKKMYA